jgi:hypothetical protein
VTQKLHKVKFFLGFKAALQNGVVFIMNWMIMELLELWIQI